MKKFKFKLNKKGVASLMKSEEMQDVLKKHASNVMNRLDKGYKKDLYIGKRRANVAISADSFKAKRDNLKNNTLLKAVGK